MNLVILTGRLTKDVELKSSQQGKSIAKATIAVRREYKNSEGKYDSDFINLIAFGNTADFLSKYFSKGSLLTVTGRIQTGSYKTNEGKTIYTTDVVVNTTEFVESKKTENATAPAVDNSGFQDIEEGFESELPFN